MYTASCMENSFDLLETLFLFPGKERDSPIIKLKKSGRKIKERDQRIHVILYIESRLYNC